MKALVFDFDGVLADTEPLYWKAWANLLAAHGLTLSWEDYCRFGRGVKDEQMLEALPQLASAPSALSSISRQMADRKEMIRSWCSQQSLIGASTVRMLQSLKKYQIGLVTSSERDEVEPMLHRAGIDQCFQASVFGDDVARHKPDPEPYLLICECLGVEGGIAFEDSDAGIQSATEAGLSTIRVAHPGDLPELVDRTLRSL